MSANKNRESNNQNLSPPNLSVNAKGSGLYVNLNQTQTGPRVNSNNNSTTKNLPVKPLTINNVNKLPSSKDNYNNPKNSNPNTPKNWYSPPSSVQSDSRPSSLAGPKQPAKKNLPKLQPIDENSVILSIDKVLSLCSNNNVEIQMNALAYLQHLTFKNNDTKMEIRNSNGLRTIIELTRSSKSGVAQNALRLLKNISFSNLEIICTDIERLAGIQRMISIIKSNSDNLLKELAVDILWNLSINYALKNIILTEAVKNLMQHIILPECSLVKKSNGDFAPTEESMNWSIILRNSLGVIRNISYESPEARVKLRDEDLLIDIIFYLIQKASDYEETDDIENVSLIDCKIIENCACILRNLTYAIQEVIDVNYLENRKTLSPKSKSSTKNKNIKATVLSPPMNDNPKGVELLMFSKYVVERLIPILKHGVNAVTLEAVVGTIQNLSAGDWEPSMSLRTEFRIQQALPLLVEIIDIAPDDVIRSAATALRNLVQEENTCLLIGSNGLHILAGKIPMHSKSKKISNPALAAILSTIYAVIKNQDQFKRKFIIEKGAQGCIYVRDSGEFIDSDDDEFPDKIPQFCKHILELLWKSPAAKELLKEKKYKQSDIVQTRNLDPFNLCAPSKSTKPEYVYDDNDNRNSVGVDSNDISFHNNQRDNQMVRDSCSTMVSNHALQQRNSMAFTTKEIPGYGKVKSNQMSKYNHSNHYSPNAMNSVTEKNDNNIRNQVNNNNNHNSNERNNINVQNKYSPRKSDMYNSYTNNSYTGSQDNISNNLSSRLPKKIESRPPPSLPNKRDSQSSTNTNPYQYEYSIPNKSHKSPMTRDNQNKADSWV